MKKMYLIIAALSFSLLGCGGSSDDSRPAQDGKGNIDIAEYLPSKDMKKEFSYGQYGPTMFGGKGYQDITIGENKVNIEQHAHSTGNFNSGDVVQMKLMTYNDMNITNFFVEDYTKFYTPSLTYRNIDLKELISKDMKTSTTSINYDSSLSNIGTELTEQSHECFYKDIVHTIRDRYQKVIEESGDFLVVECNILTKITYSIDKEYREISDKNGKSNYFETQYLTYYKKGVGLIYVEGIDKEDIPSGYAYHVHTIEYK